MAAAPEPSSDASVAEWIAQQLGSHDPFADVATASEEHRASHAGCKVYPSVSGHLLAVLAATAGARRILEIGGGLGYSTLWLAHGAGSASTVDTIEADPAHAALLRYHAASHGFAARIVVQEGPDRDILPVLAGPYDLLFYDAAIPGPWLIPHAERLLRVGALFIASNVFLARYEPDHPGLEDGAQFRQAMLDNPAWLTAFANAKLIAVHR